MGHTLDDKSSAAVGARDALQRLTGEDGVGEIAVESHQDAFYWFQVLGIKHISRHLHGVYLLAGREAVGIVAQGIALVVVGDGVAEVDGIGGIGLERVFQLDDDALSGRLDFGHLYLRWRHHHVLRGILDLDKLVEVDDHLARSDVCRLVGRRGTHHSRRLFVVPSAVGLSHFGARAEQEKQQGEHTKKSQPLCLLVVTMFPVRCHCLVVFCGSTLSQTLCLLFILSSSSSVVRLLLSRGTLCCPPSLPFDLSQSLKRSWRASTISRCCRVMSL